jgi:chromosomal replication initiation ATPase DnaA
MVEYEQELTAIARAHRLSLNDMRGPCRLKAYVQARRIAYEYLRGRGWGYIKIGEYFHRDHTTILWALGRSKKAREARAAKSRLAQYAGQQR